MALELEAIQIFVSDIKKSKKWYSDILGMKLVKEYPAINCVLMKLGDIQFYIENPCPKWGIGWDNVKIGGRTQIIFQTKDIKKTINLMKKKGVKFIEELSKRSWGEDKAVFADPDGNEFNLIET
jgi:catechol 2,3-dioxygenase-like lactoylglutathione lyase family enzyme